MSETDDGVPASLIDDGGSNDGGDGGGDPGDIDVDAIVESANKEALDGLDGGSADDPPARSGRKEEGDDNGEGGRRAPRTSDPVEDFIEKNYQGNRDAFVASLHESRNEGKRNADRIAVLEASLAERPAPARDTAAELKDRLAVDPEVQSLNQDINDINVEYKSLQTRQLEISGQARALENKIVELDAEIPHIEDPKEHSRKQSAVYKARMELTQLSSEFTGAENRIRQLKFEHKSTLRELGRAQSRVRADLVNEEQTTRATTTDAARTVKIFDAAFKSIVGQYAFDETTEAGKKKVTFVRQSVKSQLAAYLEAQGTADGLDAGDIYDGVNALLSVYTDSHGVARKAPAGSKPKQRVPDPQRRIVTPPRPAAAADRGDRGNGRDGDRGGDRGPRTPRNVEEGLRNPDFVRKRAAGIQAGMARAGRGRA